MPWSLFCQQDALINIQFVHSALSLFHDFLFCFVLSSPTSQTVTSPLDGVLRCSVASWLSSTNAFCPYYIICKQLSVLNNKQMVKAFVQATIESI